MTAGFQFLRDLLLLVQGTRYIVSGSLRFLLHAIIEIVALGIRLVSRPFWVSGSVSLLSLFPSFSRYLVLSIALLFSLVDHHAD